MDILIQPIWPVEYVVLVTGLLILLSGVSAWRSSAGLAPPQRMVIVGLRVLAVLIVGLTVLNPGRWVYPRAEPTTALPILLDTSRSMAEADVDGRSRYRAARAFAGELFQSVPDSLDPALFLIGDKAVAVEESALGDDRQPNAGASDIVGAVQSVLSRHSAAPERLERLLVISDGIQLPPGDPDAAIRAALALDVPVDTLCLGGESLPPDLWLRPERIGYLAFAEQPAGIAVRMHTQKLGRNRLEVSLQDSEGDVLQTREVRLAGRDSAALRFEFPAPATPGYYSYTLATDPLPGELQTLNNRVTVGLTVLDSAIRVLFVEGLPHWDSKFFVNLLRKHESVRITELYRLGSGRSYRIDETGERREGGDHSLFPSNVDELAEYDIVILGKRTEALLAGGGAAILQQYVRGRGGTLLFARSKPWDEPLDPLVELAPAEWGAPRTGGAFWHPTPAGVQAGLFGERLPAPDSPVWRSLPPVTRTRDIRRIPAFTRVLAEAVDGTRRVPLLLSRRYGRGHVLAVNAEGLWNWDFFPASRETREMYRNFWPLFIQWALTHAKFPPGTDLALRLAENPVPAATPVDVAVTARNAQVVLSEPLTVVLRRQGTTVRTVSLAPSPMEPGRWEGILPPSAPGVYEVAVSATSLASAPATLEVLPPPSEETRRSADAHFLGRLSEATGGRILSPAEPLNWQDMTPETPANQREQPTWMAVWDHPLWLALILVPLATEWFLRRRNMLS